MAAAIEKAEIIKLTLNCEISRTDFIFGRIGINIELPKTRISGIEPIANIVMPLCFFLGNGCTPLTIRLKLFLLFERRRMFIQVANAYISRKSAHYLHIHPISE